MNEQNTNIEMPVIVFPSQDVKQFITEVIEQGNYPGKIVEFVAHVKFMVANAEIR